MNKLIHTCRIHCHSMDPDQADLMGMEDEGKWMSFAIRLDVVIAIKLTSDDEDQPLFGCTSVFTEYGDTYIIDTPYEEFEKKFLSMQSGFIEREASL